MLDKYFGFLKIQDENSVIESLIEHTRIDEEEVHLLVTMVDELCHNNIEGVTDNFKKITKISEDSRRLFENTAGQIINAGFDHQKQYDLLRLFQRIEGISGYINTTANRIIILTRVGGRLPKELHNDVKILIQKLDTIHLEFMKALTEYTANRSNVIRVISRIEEMEKDIDIVRSTCLEQLYLLANDDQLKLGTFKAIENIVEHIESTSDVICEAAMSLEWLLIH